MKAKINIRHFLEDYAAFGTLTADARIAIEDVMQCLDPSAEQELDIDIYELLSQNRQIADIWGTEDVQQVRPDLNDDQAWEVLQTADRRYDSEYGITWTTLESIAQELFGNAPENDDAEEKQP
jgi:hypothetical protein